MKNLFIDCEWFHNQKIFLIGWAYSITEYGQLYNETLTCENMLKLLNDADGYIFFYGPDIAMIEKYFEIDVRHNYNCVNLIRIFRKYKPGLRSYKLACLEKYYGIDRSTLEYKQNIFKMWHDWNNLKLRKTILRYNMEDVLNLIRLKKTIFNEENIRNSMINEMLLQGIPLELMINNS